MKILAIIPAYNEETTIAKVIKEILAYGNIDVLVINDGSKDNTSKIAHLFEINVIDNPVNYGIGKTMRIGYQYAKNNSYDIAIQVDADGQHDVSRLGLLINSLSNNEYDMVIGSRYVKKTNYESSKIKYYGSRYFSWLIYILTNKKIADTTSGYRVANKQVIAFFAKNYPDFYPEVPMLSKLLLYGFKVKEISVEMKKRQGGVSSISLKDSVIYFFMISYVCIKIWFKVRKRKQIANRDFY